MDVYTRSLLTRRVRLPAALQNKHAAESIAELLRANVEGVCGSDGYVRPRSVQVLDISPGIIEMSSLSGHAVYNVRFTADVCNPAPGDVLTCRVENVNSYGVLAVNMSDTRVLEVILQREPVSFAHAESIDGLEPGDTVTLEVICRHFKLGQKNITLVGRAVSMDHAPRAPLEQDSDDDNEVEVDGSQLSDDRYSDGRAETVEDNDEEDAGENHDSDADLVDADYDIDDDVDEAKDDDDDEGEEEVDIDE